MHLEGKIEFVYWSTRDHSQRAKIIMIQNGSKIILMQAAISDTQKKLSYVIIMHYANYQKWNIHPTSERKKALKLVDLIRVWIRSVWPAFIRINSHTYKA